MVNWRKISEWLAAIGATSVGLMSLFAFNVVTWVTSYFGSSAGTATTIVDAAIGIAGVYMLYELFDGR